jgi:hypothetical protein
MSSVMVCRGVQVLDSPVLGPISRAVVDRFVGNDMDESEVIFPITKVPGTNVPSPVPLSNFERVYFKFGKPLDTATLDVKDRSACASQYAVCKASVELLIQELLEHRETDSDRRGAGRIGRQVMRGVSASLGSLV